MRWVRVPNGKYRNASAELQKENLCHLIVFQISPKDQLGKGIPPDVREAHPP